MAVDGPAMAVGIEKNHEVRQGITSFFYGCHTKCFIGLPGKEFSAVFAAAATAAGSPVVEAMRPVMKRKAMNIKRNETRVPSIFFLFVI